MYKEIIGLCRLTIIYLKFTLSFLSLTLTLHTYSGKLFFQVVQVTFFYINRYMVKNHYYCQHRLCCFQVSFSSQSKLKVIMIKNSFKFVEEAQAQLCTFLTFSLNVHSIALCASFFCRNRLQIYYCLDAFLKNALIFQSKLTLVQATAQRKQRTCKLRRLLFSCFVQRTYIHFNIIRKMFVLEVFIKTSALLLKHLSINIRFEDNVVYF